MSSPHHLIMTSILVPTISPWTLYSIGSCAYRYLEEHELDIVEFFVVSVWFADVYNDHYKTDYVPGSFTVIIRRDENFGNADNLRKAHRIWDSGMIPIEVVQMEGGIFFGIPRKEDGVHHSLQLCEDM